MGPTNGAKNRFSFNAVDATVERENKFAAVFAAAAASACGSTPSTDAAPGAVKAHDDSVAADEMFALFGELPA